MVFEDRISTYPNRYKLTDADGNESYVTMERADEPIRNGTPLNADTFNEMQDEIRVESVDHPGCYYHMVGTEQEWINPPMIDGVEYRTIERHNGKIVYAKKIVFGEMPTESNNFRVTTPVFPPEYKCVYLHGVLKVASGQAVWPFPVVSNDGPSIKAWLYFDKSWATLFPEEGHQADIVVESTEEIPGTIECTVKYVKG